MGRVFVYTDGLAKENLVVPLACAAVYIPNDFVYTSPADKNLYRISPATLRVLKDQWDNLLVRYALGFNKEINKYGVYGTCERMQRTVVNQIAARLTLDEVESYEVIYITRLDRCDPEARLAYCVARFLRREWFKRYNHIFPNLKLSDGNVSKVHLQHLGSFSRLPSFYIWDRAMRAVKNIHPAPPWVIHETNYYNNLFGDNNGNP